MLLSALFPSPLAAAAAAVVAAAVSVWLVRFAAQRTLAQPVAFALEAEATLLAGVVGDLRRWPYVAQVEPADFAATHHHDIWAALTAALGPDGVVGVKASDQECDALSAALGARHDQVWATVWDLLGETAQPELNRDRLGQLTAAAAGQDMTPDADPASSAAADARVVDAAEEVLACGNDRNRLSGAAVIVPSKYPNSTESDNPPMVRTWTPPSKLRHAATAACVAAVAALTPGFVQAAPLAGPSVAFAALAVLALLSMSVVVSLVDVDTLYIDVRVWAVGGSAAWMFAAVAVVLEGEPHRVVYGMVMVVAVVVLFEGLNIVFRLLRGMDGQGFGDTLVIVATVGVPPVLAADYRVGYWSVLMGLLACGLGWLVARAAGRVRRNTPFAFGPWLCVGWVAALTWFVYDSTFMLAMR